MFERNFLPLPTTGKTCFYLCMFRHVNVIRIALSLFIKQNLWEKKFLMFKPPGEHNSPIAPPACSESD